MNADRIILNIGPQTWIRIVSGRSGDHILFSIPEHCVKGEDGEPCEEFTNSIRQRKRGGVKVYEGYCKHTLSEGGRARKRRIEKYNKYRIDLFHLCKEAGFKLPVCGYSLYFYFPIKKRIPEEAKQQLHGQLHLSKPDLSNIIKAWEDSLSTTDEQISQMSGAGKFWVNQPEGYIEILLNQPLYNPFSVTFTDQNKKVSMEDIEESRRKRTARKAEIKEAKKANEPKKERPVKPIRLVDDKKLFQKEDRIK